MLTTGFLSMWISNTATTAMMVPIVEAVLREIRNKSIKNRLQKKDFGENIQANEVRKQSRRHQFALSSENQSEDKRLFNIFYIKIQYHDRRGTRKPEKGASRLASQ